MNESDSPEYLKGKIEALEYISNALLTVLSDATMITEADAVDLRVRLTGSIRMIIRDEIGSKPISTTPFGHGLSDALTDFADKILLK